MNKEKLESYLSSKKESESSYPFGPDALVYKVMGKMFSLVSQKEATPRVTLKCNPVDGEMLTGQYKSISPGYYMNKKHWITISLDGELPEEMVLELSGGSYDLVVNKLTKAEKKELYED